IELAKHFIEMPGVDLRAAGKGDDTPPLLHDVQRADGDETAFGAAHFDGNLSALLRFETICGSARRVMHGRLAGAAGGFNFDGEPIGDLDGPDDGFDLFARCAAEPEDCRLIGAEIQYG